MQAHTAVAVCEVQDLNPCFSCPCETFQETFTPPSSSLMNSKKVHKQRSLVCGDFFLRPDAPPDL